jgi:transcriptional regulator with XRE-family HTH domain
MTEETGARSGPIDDLVDAYVRYLEGVADRPSLDGLDPTTLAEATELFRLLDATWDSAVDLPPFEEDPVAIALGFVPAPPPVVARVAGPKLAQQRKQRGLRPSDLADRLNSRGISSSAKEVVRLESRPVVELDPAFLAALAAILGCSPAELTGGASPEVDDFVAWLYSDAFDREVARWAAEHDYRGQDLAVEARSRLLAARQRSGGQGDRDHWIALLRAVLNTFL